MYTPFFSSKVKKYCRLKKSEEPVPLIFCLNEIEVFISTNKEGIVRIVYNKTLH